MKKIILITVFLFIIQSSFSQSFTAETQELFVGNNETELSGGIKVLTGVLNKKDSIDIYAETGRKFTAIITKITDNEGQELNEVKPNQGAYFDLKFTQNPSTGKDYVRSGYKIYPKGFKIKTDTVISTNQKASFITLLDKNTWKANLTYKGAVYMSKGVKNYTTNKPFLQLQFKSILQSDNRSLTILIFSPKESTAKYVAKDMEVNFSGAADGKKENTILYGYLNNNVKTNFTLEITKWEKLGDSKAIISGKIVGQLPEIVILGKSEKVIIFENGIFENIEVDIINKQVDFKEVIKK